MRQGKGNLFELHYVGRKEKKRVAILGRAHSYLLSRHARKMLEKMIYKLCTVDFPTYADRSTFKYKEWS